jgi:hypothetical protein
VRTAGVFKFYLDGNHLTPDLTVGPDEMPQGNLKLGRRTAGRTIDLLGYGYEGQFQGLIDDVAVFKRALSDDEIRDLFGIIRLTGAEPDLYAAWTFDPSSTEQSSPSAPFRTVNVTGPARPVHISDDRDGVTDYASLLTPVQQIVMQLPFPLSQVWKVIQGTDVRGGSHNGFAAFAWDFTLTGPGTRDTPFYAASPGTVVRIQQNTGCNQSPANYISIKQADGEFADYLHLLSNSSRVGVLASVQVEQELGRTGDSGVTCGDDHLHLAVTDVGEGNPNLLTIPVMFSNYESSDDQGLTWYHVREGMPQYGQWLKRLTSGPERRNRGQLTSQ